MYRQYHPFFPRSFKAPNAWNHRPWHGVAPPEPPENLFEIVKVSLAPADRNEPTAGLDSSARFGITVHRLNERGEPITVAELARYFVESACPEDWLLRICARRNNGDGSAVRLYYGDGYETTVLNNATGEGYDEENILKIGVHLTRPIPDINMTPAADLPMMNPRDPVWDFLQDGMNRQQVGVPQSLRIYIRTGIPIGVHRYAPPQRPGSKHIIRVSPRPDNPYAVGQIDFQHAPAVVPVRMPAAPAVAAPPVVAAAAAAPVAEPRRPYIRGLEFTEEELGQLAAAFSHDQKRRGSVKRKGKSIVHERR